MEVTHQDFWMDSEDGRKIYVRKWMPKEGPVRGLVQVAHGMAEHGGRYQGLGAYLGQRGYVVYANDHRGQGRSAGQDPQGYLGEDRGFERLIGDMARLGKIARDQHPKVPLFFLGHSMGSFASQRFIMDYPPSIDGLILSGSNGAQGFILKLGQALATIEVAFRGSKKGSALLNKLSFGAYNKAFAPNRTAFDWLNRLEEEVDKYIGDPYCGALFPASFYRGFFQTLAYIEDPKNFPKIEKDLPIYLLAGDQDPVGDQGRGVKNLYRRYRDLGLKDLEIKLYPGARHEILLEENREEVMEDIFKWLGERTK